AACSTSSRMLSRITAMRLSISMRSAEFAIGNPVFSALRAVSVNCSSGKHIPFLEPSRHLSPRVFGCVLIVARTIISVEPVSRARIFFEFCGFSGGSERGFHSFHLGRRNTLIFGAIKAEHGSFHFRRKLQRTLRPDRLLRSGINERSIEGHAGFHIAAG